MNPPKGKKGKKGKKSKKIHTKRGETQVKLVPHLHFEGVSTLLEFIRLKIHRHLGIPTNRSKIQKNNKRQKPAARGVPKWSPTPVLTAPDAA